MIRVLLVATVALAGCVPPAPSDSPGYGAVRERLFVQCMKLAKDTVRAGHYNDSAEVIEQCSTSAYYQANSYRSNGYKGAGDVRPIDTSPERVQITGENQHE